MTDNIIDSNNISDDSNNITDDSNNISDDSLDDTPMYMMRVLRNSIPSNGLSISDDYVNKKIDMVINHTYNEYKKRMTQEKYIRKINDLSPYSIYDINTGVGNTLMDCGESFLYTHHINDITYKYMIYPKNVDLWYIDKIDTDIVQYPLNCDISQLSNVIYIVGNWCTDVCKLIAEYAITPLATVHISTSDQSQCISEIYNTSTNINICIPLCAVDEKRIMVYIKWTPGVHGSAILHNNHGELMIMYKLNDIMHNTPYKIHDNIIVFNKKLILNRSYLR